MANLRRERQSIPVRWAWPHRWVLVGAVFTSIGLLAPAAPKTPPPRPDLSDELRSLAGLHEMRVVVDNLPQPFIDAGLGRDDVRRVLVQTFTAGGFEVVGVGDGEGQVPTATFKAVLIKGSPDPGRRSSPRWTSKVSGAAVPKGPPPATTDRSPAPA